MMARKTQPPTKATETINLCLPGGKELEKMDENQRRKVLYLSKGLEHEVNFQDKVPVNKEGQLDMMQLATVMEVLNSSNPNTALQTVYHASAGQRFEGDIDQQMESAFSQIADLDPQNPIEGLLIGQMVAVNTAIGKCMRAAMIPEQYPESIQRNLTLATKLQRTFLQQVEALQKLRGKGQQTVRVEHVNVNAGGQAVVGNIEYHGGG